MKSIIGKDYSLLEKVSRTLLNPAFAVSKLAHFLDHQGAIKISSAS